jgi:predicted peroxiredoxin
MVMLRMLTLIQLLSASMVYGQNFAIDWYVLEKNCTVNVIKPGVNDLTLHIATHAKNQIDKAAVDTMLAKIEYSAGSIVLIYADKNGSFLATDMEGRNLVVKGNVTKVIHGFGSKVGYTKEAIAIDGVAFPKANYVWIKEQKDGAKSLIIQSWGSHMLNIDVSKVYDVSELMVEMAEPTKYKTIK